MSKIVWLLLPLLLLGCAVNAPTTGDAGPSLPTATPRPEPTATALFPTTFAGGANADGTFFRGSADAPVTLIEYSDFL